MGKASSAKKVARAARAGGSRRPGQRRPIGFPLIVASVVILGFVLVVFARSSRDATAEPRSQADGADAQHWHAAYGLSFCGEFVRTSDEGTALTDVGEDALGIHTHGDSIIHIHPFIDSAAGRNARMQIFFDQVTLDAADSTVTFPDGETWDEAEEYLYAKAQATYSTDPEQGRKKGMDQFLEEKSYRPGLKNYRRD